MKAFIYKTKSLSPFCHPRASVRLSGENGQAVGCFGEEASRKNERLEFETAPLVTPAEAGVQERINVWELFFSEIFLDSRLRGNDKKGTGITPVEASKGLNFFPGQWCACAGRHCCVEGEISAHPSRRPLGPPQDERIFLTPFVLRRCAAPSRSMNGTSTQQCLRGDDILGNPRMTKVPAFKNAPPKE